MPSATPRRLFHGLKIRRSGAHLGVVIARRWSAAAGFARRALCDFRPAGAGCLGRLAEPPAQSRRDGGPAPLRLLRARAESQLPPPRPGAHPPRLGVRLRVAAVSPDRPQRAPSKSELFVALHRACFFLPHMSAVLVHGEMLDAMVRSSRWYLQDALSDHHCTFRQFHHASRP